MPYLKNFETVFVHIPKCAGKSVESWLSRLGRLDLTNEPAANWGSFVSQASKAHVKSMHLSFLDILRIIKKEKKDLFFFSIVRNPYSRIASQYLFMKRHYRNDNHSAMPRWRFAKESKDFKEFLDRLYFCDDITRMSMVQFNYICGSHEENLMDKVVKFESLSNEIGVVFDTVIKRNKVRWLIKSFFIKRSLPVVNCQPSYDWKNLYDDNG